MHARVISGVGLFLIAFCSEIHATTVLALVDSDRILIGADSKITVIQPGKITEQRGCKIRKVGNLFFAQSGLMNMAGFNVAELVTKALDKGRDIKSSLREMESLLVTGMSKFLTGKEGVHPTVVIFGFDGRTFLHEREFVPTFINGVTTIAVKRLDCPSDCPTIVGGSATNAPYDFVKKNPSYWTKNGDVAFLKQLILADIEAAPHRSGLPIDILRVSSKGAEWIEKKPECQ